MSEYTFRAGEILFRQGDPSDTAYHIESGEVEVLDENGGRETRLGLLGAGDIVGEMGLVDERPRSLTARALSEVCASAVTRDDFVDLILHQPEQSLRYLRALFERLRSMNTRAIASGHPAHWEDRTSAAFEVTLLPLTDKATEAVPADGLRLPCSPYRVGRAPAPGESSLDQNDLLLADEQPFRVSRNHFSIEIRADGVYVHDRGSYLGTLVNGNHIGGNHQTGSALLAPGENEVVVGSKHSPFRYCVRVAPV